MILLAVECLIFAFSLWLGLYLFSRNLADVRLRLAGLGLAAYAMGLALDLLLPYAGQDLAPQLQNWQRPFLILPALCWLGLLIVLLPGETSWRERLRQQRRPYAIILTATIFFGLGIGFIFFPLAWLPRGWVLPSIGLDLLLLGSTIAFLDAFNEGEALLPHLLHSLADATVTAFIFGGQVVLVMAISTGVTFSMLVLLLTITAAAILVQTFSNTFQAVLDRVVFVRFPQVRNTRADLRLEASIAPRMHNTSHLDTLDEDEFVRLTRRALGHMGNLPKLAANPLTQLPLINVHLKANGHSHTALTLERANVLKLILCESIARLKPPGTEAFGTSDAWRHYNALYFPYVVGIRPYSRRRQNNDYDTALQPILAWFHTEVPQRTLYNWQNAAAALIARDLREQSRAIKEGTPPLPL